MRTLSAIFVVFAVIFTSYFFVNQQRSNVDPIVEVERVNVPSADNINANDTLCLNGKTFHGCCSGKDGIDGFRNGILYCNDGDQSPTCGAEIEGSLQGCCKDHGGVDKSTIDGIVVCNDGEESPSCNVGICRAPEAY